MSYMLIRGLGPSSNLLCFWNLYCQRQRELTQRRHTTYSPMILTVDKLEIIKTSKKWFGIEVQPRNLAGSDPGFIPITKPVC